MALGGGMSCVKYLLFCFNLLFAITGLIILGVGIRALIMSSPYSDLADGKFYYLGPITFIVVGIIVFIVAFFGCCGAAKENHCMIVTFAVLLLLIFLAEMAVGITGYMKHQELEDSIVSKLTASIKDYKKDPDVAKKIDVIQTDLSCCGVSGPGDWANNSLPIPDSCCGAKELGAPDAACGPASPFFHADACLPKVLAHLKGLAYILAGVGVGIAVVQLLGVIFSCCLARSIRSQYETV